MTLHPTPSERCHFPHVVKQLDYWLMHQALALAGDMGNNKKKRTPNDALEMLGKNLTKIVANQSKPASRQHLVPQVLDTYFRYCNEHRPDIMVFQKREHAIGFAEALSRKHTPLSDNDWEVLKKIFLDLVQELISELKNPDVENPSAYARSSIFIYQILEWEEEQFFKDPSKRTPGPAPLQ